MTNDDDASGPPWMRRQDLTASAPTDQVSDVQAASTGEGGRRLARADGALWRRTPRGLVALGPRATEPVLINGSGTELWDLLAAPRTPVELSQDLGQMYDVAPALVLAQITPVLEELVRLGLLAPCCLVGPCA